LQSLPLEHWDQLESQMVLPQVKYLLGQLESHFNATPQATTWASWRDRYRSALDKLLGAIRNEGAKKSEKVSRAIGHRLSSVGPETAHSCSLSTKVLAVLANTPGVSCVLNGMRRRRYVEDSMRAMQIAPFVVTQELYRSFRLSH